MRKAYFHDVLKALTDAKLEDLFMAWVDKHDPHALDSYRSLYMLAHERGMEVLLEQIKSGEFADELQRL